MSRGIPAMMMYSDKKTPMKIVRSMDRVQANSLEHSLSRQGELGIFDQRAAADAATAAMGLPCSNPSRIALAFAVACGSSAIAKIVADFPPSINLISTDCSLRRIRKRNSSPGFRLRSQG